MSVKNGQMRHGELDSTIARLGAGRIRSPMSGVRFTGENERVLDHAWLEELEAWRRQGGDPPAMEVAGSREMLFFDPATLACGIVTCGGICPGLNDVIRAIVLSLHHHYGVKTIHGFRFGYEGLVRRHGHTPLPLTADAVNRINEIGGTILGILPRAAGSSGDGRHAGAPRRRNPLRHRRRRDAPRSAEDRRGSIAAGPRRGGRPTRPTRRRSRRATESGW